MLYIYIYIQDVIFLHYNNSFKGSFVHNFRSIRKEGKKCLFNDSLNTFYLRLYDIGHIVKYYSDGEKKPAAATWATLSD